MRKALKSFGLPALTLVGTLSGCAVHLQQASIPWEGKPRLVRQGGKNWGPNGSRTAQVPRVSHSSVNTSVDSKWKVAPPELGPAHPQIAPLKAAAENVLETAQQYLGTPYRYGGESPSEGFDCSGFVQYVFSQQGISLERTADRQFLQGQPVSRQNLSPGDLVFFSSSGKYVDHVGIYAGNELFIHAPRTGRTVSYDSLDSQYYQVHFQGARRLLH